MGSSDISYEEFVPTDRWTLQDWYLSRMFRCDGLYVTLLGSRLGGSVNRRSLISFFSLVIAYNVSAKYNIEKHLGDEKYAEFVELIKVTPDVLGKNEVYDVVDSIMLLLSEFHWVSGLSQLKSSRVKGTFGRARAHLGLDGVKKSGDARE